MLSTVYLLVFEVKIFTHHRKCAGIERGTVLIFVSFLENFNEFIK